jgi:hypothetical protein
VSSALGQHGDLGGSRISAALRTFFTDRNRADSAGYRQPIGDERLAARPAAVTCIRCAAKGSR